MHKNLLDAVDLIGHAVIDRRDWSSAFDVLGAAAKSSGVVMFPSDQNAVSLGIQMSASLRESVDDYVRGAWFKQDERAIRGWPLTRRQPILLEQQLTCAEERARLPFYQEFLRKHDLEWWAGIVCGGTPQWCLTFQRSPRADPFDMREASELASVAPHIATFLKLAEQIHRTDQQLTLNAWEFAGISAILLGAQAQVLGMTGPAESMIVGAIAYRRGRLAAQVPSCDARFQSRIAALCASQSIEAVAQRFAIQRLGGLPLVIEGLPLPADVGGIRARAVLLLSDGSAQKVFDDSVLREAFDFTPAEARLASQLAAGGSAKDAATRMSLSHETVRAHLKRMFDKTRTARQAELLRLLERYGHRPRKD